MIDNNVIIDGSETNIINEQHRNKDEERVGGGKLLVQRYTPSKHLVHNAAGTAVANAVQEPGVYVLCVIIHFAGSIIIISICSP